VKAVRRSQADRDPEPRGLTSRRGLHRRTAALHGWEKSFTYDLRTEVKGLEEEWRHGISSAAVTTATIDMWDRRDRVGRWPDAVTRSIFRAKVRAVNRRYLD